MKTKPFLIFALFLFMACKQNPEDMIPFIQGYWEISEVKKDGDKLKEFNVNMTIDYFEIQEDLKGFRKKLTPTLDGRFKGSEHQALFELKNMDGELIIEYQGGDSNHLETVKKATDEELVLQNDQGFIYIYKPYTPIDFD